VRPAPPHGRPGESGVVIIFMVAIIAALAVMATAFIIVTREESSASSNALAAVQADEAARAALEHAIGEIEYCEAKQSEVGPGKWLAICPDGVMVNAVPPSFSGTDGQADSGWHRRFSGSDVELPWVDHYNNETFSKSLVGLPGCTGCRPIYPSDTNSAWIDFPKSPPDRVGRYVVAVIDLDGHLASSLGAWDASIEGPLADIGSSLDEWQSRDGVASPPLASVLTTLPKLYSHGELAGALGTLGPFTLADTKGWLKGITCYPVPDGSPPSQPLPAVNVNTARAAVLDAILLKIPTLEADDCAAVRDAIIDGRPFADRLDLDEALKALAPDPVGSGTHRLEEIEFNDLLNSLNGAEGSYFANDGVFDKDVPANCVAGTSGIYEMKFDAGGTPPPPPPSVSNVGGAATKASDVTWCTTLKFSSRWFQIHARAQVLDPKSNSVLAWRELQAVYDSQNDRIVYFRWETADR